MTDIMTYVIVFGLIIIGVIIWQLRYGKARPYWLSHQIFPELKLWVFVEKKDGKHKSIIIKTEQGDKTQTYAPTVELINNSRENQIIQSPESEPQISKISENKITIEYKYDFNKLSKVLNSTDFNFSTFRFSIKNAKGQMYKSHELAFDKRWTIYRPDSGKYN
jgi:hypothetical protein